MSTVVTRPCEYMTVRYAVGDVIENHDIAARLMSFGFAEHQSDDDPPSPEPTPTPARTRAATPKE